MDLEIREFNFLKSQYPADTTKSLYYVFGLNLIFGLVRPRTIKFSIHFQSQNNYDGYIGGRIKLRSIGLKTTFLTEPVKIVLKIKNFINKTRHCKGGKS